MRILVLLPLLLAGRPLAATAQTTTKPATQQVTEVSEDLDPATGKVIRRTTRTYSEPVGTAPSGAASTSTVSKPVEVEAATVAASDADVSAFLKTKTVVSSLSALQLLKVYDSFMTKVRNDRRTWTAANWTAAAAVLSALNARYEQVRSSYGLDDKVTIRSQQAEFQTLRTARQLSDQVVDKL